MQTSVSALNLRSSLPNLSGQLAIQSSSLAIQVKSALVYGESNLHCYFHSVALEVRVETLLYCWDPVGVATVNIEPGAKIFDGMKAKACENLPKTEHQSAHFALLLHISVNLSHHLQLGERQTEFNHIIDNRQMKFDQMQDAVFAFFAREASAPQVQAEPTQPSLFPLLPQSQFEQRVAAKAGQQSQAAPAQPQPQVVTAPPAKKTSTKAPVKQQKSRVKKQGPRLTLPELRLPEVKLPTVTLPKVTLPEIKLPEATLVMRKRPNIGRSLQKWVAANPDWMRLSHAAADVVVGIKRIPIRIKGIGEALGRSAPVRAAKFGAEVVRAGIERTACAVRDGLKAAPGITADAVVATAKGVAKAASAVAGAVKRVFNSGFQRY